MVTACSLTLRLVFNSLISAAGSARAGLPHPHGDVRLRTRRPLPGVLRRPAQHGHQGRGRRRLRQPHAVQRVREGDLQVPASAGGGPTTVEAVGFRF